jgi:hypothetical protein
MLVVVIAGLFIFTVYGIALTRVLYHAPTLETANDILQDNTATIQSFGNTEPLPPPGPDELGYEHIELVPYIQNSLLPQAPPPVIKPSFPSFSLPLYIENDRRPRRIK